MSANFGLKVIAGAVAAVAVGSTAMANTNLNNTTTGDVFINIVDTTNGSSFLFDTGVSQASFNTTQSSQFNFGSDPNYAAFLAAEGGGDNVDYSVFSATGNGAGTETLYFTSSIAVPTRTATNMATAAAAIGGTASAPTTGFLPAANQVTSSTTNSAYLTAASGASFGSATYEGVISNQLLNSGTANSAGGYADDAALGTSLAFYEDAASRTGVSQNGVALAGTWDVVGGVASYTAGTSNVPLPTPVLLLLSGLGLMGVVTRRNKTV